jgi:ArsR family transcriptional regulator, arsenate/arsenite/antimonite-responsive transcriptional repressor
MSRAKTELFESELASIAEFAKALAHPVRIRILKILAEENVCICGEIVDRLPLAQSTVSQHLKELKRAGLIKGEVEGPKTCYCLDRRALDKALKSFSGVFSSIRCCQIKKGGSK